jgi:hypothetical protein
LERAGRTFIEIELPTGRRTVPLIELEEVLETADALTDFTTGKLSGPDDLRRALTHMRMTGKLADIIYSIGATNTEFHAYQFKPVLKLLNSPSRGVLIADEVGLGKTIEAGLIWTELVARFDSRRLLIVCPKPLTEKWREELRSKFNVDARICNAADLLDRIKDDQVRREGFAAIASISAIRPPKNWNNPDEPAKGPRAELARYIADAEEELFDLAVFDEAHHLRNTETLNHKLGQMVSEASDYSVFLSATPINLRANDLRAILKLIDPETFEREWLFDVLQAENAPMIAAWEAARDPRTSMGDLIKLVDELPEGQVLKTRGASSACAMNSRREWRIRRPIGWQWQPASKKCRCWARSSTAHADVMLPSSAWSADPKLHAGKCPIPSATSTMPRRSGSRNMPTPTTSTSGSCSPKPSAFLHQACLQPIAIGASAAGHSNSMRKRMTARRRKFLAP